MVYLRQGRRYFGEKQVVQWFLQLAMAVRYLHSRRILHRDLKTENVFLNKSCSVCKLGMSLLYTLPNRTLP